MGFKGTPKTPPHLGAQASQPAFTVHPPAGTRGFRGFPVWSPTSATPLRNRLGTGTSSLVEENLLEQDVTKNSGGRTGRTVERNINGK